MADATMVEIRNFFGYDNLSKFRTDWLALTDDDKRQIKEGIGNGTLTY